MSVRTLNLDPDCTITFWLFRSESHACSRSCGKRRRVCLRRAAGISPSKASCSGCSWSSSARGAAWRWAFHSSTCVALSLPEGGKLVAGGDVRPRHGTWRVSLTGAGPASKGASSCASRLSLMLDAPPAKARQGRWTSRLRRRRQGELPRLRRALPEPIASRSAWICNATGGGSVPSRSTVDPSDPGLDERLRTDERVSISLVPIGDGLFLARKR